MRIMLKAAILACALSFIGFQGVNAQKGGATTQAWEEGAACKGCQHNLDINEHWFNSWFNICTSGSDCYDCHAFNACHRHRSSGDSSDAPPCSTASDATGAISTA